MSRILGGTGLSISEISLGGVAFTFLNKTKSSSLINYCLDSGINYMDVYTGTGRKIGNVLKERRKDFYLSTRGNSKSINTSLKDMNVDFFDIFFISMVDSREQYGKALYEADLLEKERASGKFRFLGIATHNPSLYLRIIKDGIFSVLMFPLNCVDEISPGVFKSATDKNMGIIAMKPLAGGNLVDYGASLKYVLDKNITTALIGMKNIAEVKKNMRVLLDREITDEDRSYYKQIRKKLGKTFCRYCGHCIFPDPCPVGIEVRIIMMLKTLAYQSNGRKTISDETLLKVKKCIKCGRCERRCPYKLPIRELLPGKVQEYLKMTRSSKRGVED